MADNINDTSNDEECIDETGSDKSFVGKFVSGLINNTPLSKWFKNNNSATKPIIRRRGDENYDDEDEDDSLVQPPVKRPKLPPTINEIQRNNFTTTPTKPAQNRSSNNNINVFNSFLQPIPGPSGTQTKKLFNNINAVNNSNIEQNDTDDSEEESTSGYSSSAPLKASIVYEHDVNKINKKLNKDDLNAPEIANINDNNNKTSDINSRTSATIRSLFIPSQDGSRSLFSERSLNRTNTSLSSRRPNFNPSILGSPNFIDKTITTNRIMKSPFYNGRTTYGGASSLSLTTLNKNNTTKTKNSRSTSVVVKPINKKLTNSDDNITLSKTARRILNTLEQYSTPISDAKKIPISPKNDDKSQNSNSKSGILSKYVGANPYLIRAAKSLPTNKELQVPHLLQMKQKERLQNSTENVRQIAITSKSDLNKEEYSLPAYDNDRTNEKQSKHVNKIKNNLTSVRQNKIQIEQIVTINDVKLPNVQLPITILPKFDFGNIVDDKIEKISPIKTNENNYKFSKPVVISENFKTIQAINCFKFSEPVDKKQKTTTITNNFKIGDNTTKLPLTKLKNNGENCMIKPAPELITTGSCIDILKNSNKNQDKFVANKNTWECQACLVRNDNDKNECTVCEMAREKSVNYDKNTTSFGDKFKPSPTTWECPTCMIRNRNELDKCEACQTDNPNCKKSPIEPTLNFRVKPSNDTWECSSCWIRNKNDIDKCIACQSVRDKPEKSTSLEKQAQQFNFGDKFKLQALQTWECPTCMIRNKNDLNKCAACETLKPIEQSTSSFSFGVPTNNDWECKSCKTINNTSIKCNNCGISNDTNNVNTVGFGDGFKLKQNEWECTSCLVRNKNDLVKCACCGTLKPGCNDINTNNITTEKTTVSFNFGIDKQDNFKFGIPTTSTSTKTTNEQNTFIFGNSTKTTTNTTETSTTNGFNFGIKPQSENKINENNQKIEETVSIPSFKFGVDKVTVTKSSEISDKFPKKIEIPASLSADGLTKKPTFEFKPVNGDINKSNMFTSVITTTTTTTSITTTTNNIFGTKPSISRTVTTSSPTFKFGSNSSISSTTTVPTTITITTITTTATPIVTGITKLAPTTNSGLFKFGSANIQSSAISSTKRSFGDVSSSSNNGGIKEIKADFQNSNGFGSTTITTTAVTTTKLPTFGSGDNKTINFGNASKSVNFGTTTTTSSGFGSMNENRFNTSVDSTKSLNFGTSDKPLGTFSFGNTDTNKTINFGSLDKTKSFGLNSEQKQTVQGFGLNNSNFTTNETKSNTFGTNEPKSTGFGNLSKPVFGTTDSKSVFGTSSTSTIESKPNLFTNNDMKSTNFSVSAPKPSIFGTPEPVKPFSFNTTTNTVPTTTNEPKSASFSFGQQQSSENKSNEPSQPFKFGNTSDINNTTNTSGFNFTMTTPLPNTTFNFGNGTKTETTATIQPAQNQGIFGGSISNNNNNNTSSNNGGASWAKSGSFNFGTTANNNNQKAIFTFGASQTNQTNFPQQSTTTPSVTATVAPQPTTGFSFGPSTQASVSSGFNFTGAMPTFNFTDGASNSAQPQRKLRKALRRIHR